MRYIKLSIENNIAIIQLNKPEKLNAMNNDLLKELSNSIEKVQNDESIKCLYIKGNAQAFCAGGDLEYMAKMNQFEAREASLWIQRIFERIEELPFFTMAIIEGIAFGGGLELALACDIRIATETAQFALPEMRYGIIPAGGGTRRYQEKAGYADCIYAMSANKILSANEALNLGLIQDIIKSQDIKNFQENYSKKIMNYSLNSILEVKSLLKTAMKKDRSEAFRDEAELFGRAIENEGGKKIQDFFESRKQEK